MHDIEHDDEAITAKLRGYVAEIRELDDASRELDRRRRDIYSEARNFGFDGRDQADCEAASRWRGAERSERSTIYVEMLGGERATDQMRKGKSFSEVAFGSCGWPSDFADDLGDLDAERNLS
jgi:uncharacterized protein (UPF0335 family)